MTESKKSNKTNEKKLSENMNNFMKTLNERNICFLLSISASMSSWTKYTAKKSLKNCLKLKIKNKEKESKVKIPWVLGICLDIHYYYILCI